MVEYKLLAYKNRFSKYKWVVTRTYPGFFDYRYCIQADVDKYKEDLSTLYRVSKDNV